MTPPLHSRGGLRGVLLRRDFVPAPTPAPAPALAPAPVPALGPGPGVTPAGSTDCSEAGLVLIAPLDRLDSAAVPVAGVSEDGPTDRQNGDL